MELILEAVLNLLRNNIIIASRYVPAILSPCLAFWVLSLTQQKSVDIRIICKQKDLYAFFGVQRSVFLSTLDELKEDGIIDYNAKEIIILDRSRLKDMLLGTSKDDF